MRERRERKKRQRETQKYFENIKWVKDAMNAYMQRAYVFVNCLQIDI